MKIYYLVFVLFLLAFSAFAQNLARLDSLQIAFEQAQNQDYAPILKKIAQEQEQLSFGIALKIAQKCVSIAQKSATQKSLPAALCNLAELHAKHGEFTQATDYFFEALQSADRLAARYQVAQIIDRLAQLYQEQDNSVMALEYLLSATEIYKEIGHQKIASQKYQQIAHTHLQAQGYENAIFYFKEAMRMGLDSMTNEQKIQLYYHLGKAYQEQKNYEQSYQTFYIALDLAKNAQLQKWTAQLYGALGILQKQQGNLSVALRFLELDLQMSHQNQEWERCIELMNNFGEIYTYLGTYNLAKNCYDSALFLSKKYNFFSPLLKIYKGKAQIAVLEKKFEEAYHFQEKFMQVADSLNKQKTTQEINKVQAAYNFQKKQAQIELLLKDNQIHEETIKKQRLISSLVAVALFSLSLIAFVLFQSNKHKKNLNQQLQHQKSEIETQKNEIEEKSFELSQAFNIINQNNKRLLDSINYAKHIQVSMLPSSEAINRTFSENFIFFKPRDVVSGDFYWFHAQNHRSILAAIDCTGHGVPGAFISMIANELLNEIVILKNIYQANQILAELHKSLKVTLRQNETENRDGMDIALCVVHQVPKEQKEWFGEPRVEFSGANSPIVYIQDAQLFEVKANKYGIGGKQSQDELDFECHTIFLDKSKTFYLFSDGYHDQLGGEYGRKFLSRRFKDLLLEIHEKPMAEQKNILEKTIKDWQDVHKEKQTDDMLVIGFRC